METRQRSRTVRSHRKKIVKISAVGWDTRGESYMVFESFFKCFWAWKVTVADIHDMCAREAKAKYGSHIVSVCVQSQCPVRLTG